MACHFVNFEFNLHEVIKEDLIIISKLGDWSCWLFLARDLLALGFVHSYPYLRFLWDNIGAGRS